MLNTAVVMNAKAVAAAAVAADKERPLFAMWQTERIYRLKTFFRVPWTSISEHIRRQNGNKHTNS
jgi:hypothetical protein